MKMPNNQLRKFSRKTPWKNLKKVLLLASVIVVAFASSGTTAALNQVFLEEQNIRWYTGSCAGPQNGCGASFTVASYNVLGYSHRKGDWKERIGKVKKNIIDNNVGVVGFQELQKKQYDYLDDNLTGYERTSKGKAADSIMWDTSVFEKVADGTWETEYFDGKDAGTAADKIQEPWVKLRSISTNGSTGSGQEFYFMSLHDPIDNTGTNASTRLSNVNKHIEQIKKFKAEGLPVIIVGDFNQGMTKDAGSGATSHENTAYCKLTKDGFMNHTYDLWKGRQVKCPNPPAKGDKIFYSSIDNIFVSPGITVSNFFHIEGFGGKGQKANLSGSDHPAVISTITIPGNCPNNTSVPDWVGMPTTIKATPGGAVKGNIVAASINARSPNTLSGIHTVSTGTPNPDFIALNEASGSTAKQLENNAPGYGAWKNPKNDTSKGSSGQSIANAILWKKDKWDLLDKGQIRITDDDQVKFNGNKTWDRFAVWGVFKRKTDGAVVPFISTHMMTHATKNNQWGNQPFTRMEQYGLGVDILTQLINLLSSYGPVIIGGDMNNGRTHDKPWSVAPKLAKIGYKEVHSGVDTIFYPKGTKLVSSSAPYVNLGGDHGNNYIKAKIKMNGVTPTDTAVPQSTNTTSTSSASGCVCNDPSAQGPSGEAPSTPNLKSFIDEYVDYAVTANKEYGIPYETNLAQGYLESGGGDSILSKKYFNFHGLKAGSTWDGPVVDLKTQEEYTPGNTTTITDGFRVFSNAEAGWKGYGEFITKNSRYSEALKYPGDPYKYLQEIKNAGYATDSQYVSKVSKIIDSVITYVKDKNLAPPSSQIQVTGGGGDNSGNISSSDDCGDTPGAGNAADIVRVAKEELAKSPVEYDDNVMKYTTNRREPWCADFVSWVYKEAGSPFSKSGGNWQIPSVSSMQTWFKENGHYFEVGEESPKPGDVAFYMGNQTPDGGSTSHVNIVIEVNGDKMTTIGGNESDKVKQSTGNIKLGESSLVGFGRMK